MVKLTLKEVAELLRVITVQPGIGIDTLRKAGMIRESAIERLARYLYKNERITKSDGYKQHYYELHKLASDALEEVTESWRPRHEKNN